MYDYLPRAELDKLALIHGTDKASRGHDYMRFYEFFLNPFKEKTFVLIELGVGPKHNKGKSLLTWRDYFPHATIVGVDIRQDAKEVETDRVHIEIGDCSKPNFLRELSRKYAPLVIVDDASHKWSHQILALETLFPALEAGGLYVVEDLQTSFEPLRRGVYADNTEDAFSFLIRLAHMVGGSGLGHPALDGANTNSLMKSLAEVTDMIAFYGRTALIAKRSGIPKRDWVRALRTDADGGPST
ncbi:MAG TPA: hypothetical protein VII49_14300 [Rhizomicrobium sp.]